MFTSKNIWCWYVGEFKFIIVLPLLSLLRFICCPTLNGNWFNKQVRSLANQTQVHWKYINANNLAHLSYKVYRFTYHSYYQSRTHILHEWNMILIVSNMLPILKDITRLFIVFTFYLAGMSFNAITFTTWEGLTIQYIN